MPKVCGEKCKESNSQEFEDRTRFCPFCSGRLIPVNQLLVSSEQIEIMDPNIIQEFSHELVDYPQLVFDIISNNIRLQELPIVSDVEPHCQHCLTIQFYTIVLVSVWLETEAICLKIGTENFNNFGQSYCRFLPIRKIEIFMDNKTTEFFIITGCIRVPLNFIDSNTLDFPYKYFFCNKDESGVYEDLHHHNKSYNYNRHFFRGSISEDDTKNIRQFDMMIIPQCTDVYLGVRSLAQWIPNWKGNSIPYKNLIDRIFISLIAFLPLFMRIGYYPARDKCDSFDDFFKVLNEMLDLLLRLKISSHEQKYDPNDWYTPTYIDQTGKPLLLQKFINYIFQKGVKYDLQHTILRIYLSIILYNNFPLNKEEIVSVVTDALNKNIFQIISTQQMTIEWVGKNNRSSLRKGILQFLRYPHLHGTHYFQLLALYHILFFPNKSHINYLNSFNYIDSLYWGIPEDLIIPKSGHFSKEDFRIALKLSTEDPILSYSIVYISLDNSNWEIFKETHNNPNVLPLSALISFILFKRDMKRLKTDLFKSIFNFLIHNLSRQIYQISSVEIPRIFSLLLKLSSEFDLVTKDQEDFFSLLNLLAQECNIIVDDISPVQIDSILNFFKEWHKFKFDKLKMNEQDFEKEMYFWNKMLKVKFPPSIPSWTNDVNIFLKNRLNQTQLKPLFFNLFIIVHERFSAELEAILNEELMRILKQSDVEEKKKFLDKLITLSPKQLKSLSDVFSSLLLLEREHFMRNKLYHLLNWSPWKSYFALATIEEIFEILDEGAKTLLKEALDNFSKLINSICSFQIKITDSNFYSEKENFIKSLAELVFKGEGGNTHSIEEIGTAIKYCFKATEWIENHRKHLESLQALFDIIQEFNYTSIEDILELNLWNKLTIAELVEINGENYRFIDSNIESIVSNKNFILMATSGQFFQDSVIFISIFNNSKFSKKQALTLDILFDSVWVPTVQEVERILNTSLDQTILLSDVRNNFTTLNIYESTLSELQMMYSGIQHAHSKTVDMDFPQFKECSKNIASYVKLAEYSEAAFMLIKLKNCFSIETDFKLIEDIQNIEANFDQKPLSIIDEEFKKLSQSLQIFTPENIKVLENILEEPSISFINWANTNLKDLNELKTFVEIALTSSNEVNSEIDRIMILNSVCTNLAPLIFDVSRTINYNILIEVCNKIFSEFKRNDELIGQLIYVSEFNKFWESLKTSQVSLKEGSLMKLTNIACSGIFTVSTKISRIPTEMISLVTTKYNVEEKYDMEQLTDLRSKLTLVINKSDTNVQYNYKETIKESQTLVNNEKFKNLCDNLSDLANIFGELVEIGVIGYFKYEFIFEFKEDHQKVEKEIERARKDLAKRQHGIKIARVKHYFLNFYTISQLVILQEGLLSYINSSNLKSQEQLYHLLSLLNTDVTTDQIGLALRLSDITQHSLSSPATSNIRYLFAGAQKSANTKQEFESSQNKIQKPNLKNKFPDSFSQNEKAIAEELSSKGTFLHFLIINGIKAIKSDGEKVTKTDLIKWCDKNKNLVGNTAPDVYCTVHDDSPEEIDEYSHDSGDHISIFKLGTFLKEIYQLARHKLPIERKFYSLFKLQEPNLIFVPNHLLYESVLFLYKNSPDLPLPLYSEVLLCSGDTSIEEIDILWRRALYKSDYNHFYLFCIVGIDELNYQVAVQAVKLLREYVKLESNDKFKLVIICREEKKDQSYMAAALEHYERISHITDIDSLDDIHEYLYQKFTSQCVQTSKSCWLVDKEKSRVRLVVSDSVGAGKSLYINNLKSDLLSQGIISEEEIEQSAVTVAIHGRQASEEHLAEQLLKRSVSGVKHGVMYHVDVASTVQLCLVPILFKLVILGGICKKSGELWHCRGIDYYVIEMTSSSKQVEFPPSTRLYPNSLCIQPFNVKETPGNLGTQATTLEVLKEEQYQRVCAYLGRLDNNKDFDNYRFNQAEISKRLNQGVNNLEILLKHCGILYPSWVEVRNFVSFLDRQLSNCENSHYCQSGIMGQEWKGFKSFVVKFMILMSRDFATPSLKEDNGQYNPNILTHFELIERRKWENNYHPYIFFNPDGHTMTFLGFHISNQGHLVDSDNPSHIIENNMMQPQLLQILTINGVNLQENFNLLSKMQKVEIIAGVIGMGIECIADPDPGYVLTLDNVRKILAILMRFRCNIPVVIMGETGCGKTQLIQFMCSLQISQLKVRKNMLILKVHGGTTETDVMCKVEEAEKLAFMNYFVHKVEVDTVLFFDEANTSPAIGLIKEIMCDRRMYGRHIRTDIGLQFIAACNPYRKHTEEMLNKLSSAGLGFFTKSSETTDRLGDIPLRELVYRVMELPASLRPLVWDFGQLSNSIEKEYTREIVAKHLRARNSPIEAQDDIINVISDVLTNAQNYMKEQNDECSFVSLRDVERTMRVMLWFFGVLKYLVPNYFKESTDNTGSIEIINSQTFDLSESFSFSIGQSSRHPDLSNIHGLNKISYSLILALAVCYRARLRSRKRFDEKIYGYFKQPLTPIHDNKVIDEEIDKCQQGLLDHMEVTEHIAKNKALRENVFMMFVCIELKIPLFLIGKPGSSKSLAKSIISNNMQGNKCQDRSMLRNFKAVHIMSYQCSQLSTAEGIIGVFNNCKKMQKQTHSSNFVACVVLDEVGLAEDSPLLPLKVLHPLLEDTSHEFGNIANNIDIIDIVTNSTTTHLTNGVGNDVICRTEEQVAFIGISNWSLDPAKMNRGIMVTRGDPDEEELLCSAKEICHSESIDPEILKSIEKWIPKLAKSYLKFVRITDTSREYHGLRDFYSLIKMLVYLCDKYKTELNDTILTHSILRNFGGSSNTQLLNIFMQEISLPSNSTKGPDNTPMGLIRANLSSSSSSFHAETRYLLLLTENYSALNILLKSSNLWPRNTSDHVRVLFGSHFPRDQDYSTACRNINKIKVCMETGKTVILLHLELLYESLYDTLNQYYMKISNQRYIDLGLGTHRMKCRVHEQFKLIVIAEKDTVYNTFPTPLINRLEKHLLTMPIVLSGEGIIIAEQLATWARDFSNVVKTNTSGSKIVEFFSEGDCFIGYHSDTPHSIVFDVLKEMEKQESDQEFDKESALEKSQTNLLKMATIDAVFRLKNSVLANTAEIIQKHYFKLQQGSLKEYLKHILVNIAGNSYTLVTTHSRILTNEDVKQLTESLCTDQITVDISCLSLQLFQTEYEFTREIQIFFNSRPETLATGGTFKKVLLVQCERGADNANLIACARHKTVDELRDWQERGNKNDECKVCIVFLVPLQRESHGSKFVSLCGGNWDTVHIDDIRSVDYIELLPMSHMIDKHIYQLFMNSEPESPTASTPLIFWRTRLKHCIQPAISKLVDSNGSEERGLTRLQQFAELIQSGDNDEFYVTFCQRLAIILKEQSEYSLNTNCSWLLRIANCESDIQSSGTFRKAVSLGIDCAITPLLSELLAQLDRNGNLELALFDVDAEDHSLYNIWQDIFRNEELFTLSYKDTISPTTQLPRRRVPVLSDGPGGRFFQVKFPFSFLIQELMNNLWQNFIKIKGNINLNTPKWYIFEKQLFARTPLAEIFNTRFKSIEKYYESILLYLKDFLHMSFNPKTQGQCEVYEFVILSCVEYFPPVEEGEQPKLTIPKIHYGYNDSKQLLNLLQQAFEIEESLGIKLYEEISILRRESEESIFVELLLLEAITKLCSHREERTARKSLAEKYVTEIRRWESVVQEAFVLLDRRDDSEVSNTIQIKWHRIIALQLFISHCSLGESNEYTNHSIESFRTILDKTDDFTSVLTFEMLVSGFLTQFPILPRFQENVSKAIIRQYGATSCFINILTNITFRCKLNAELINYLVKLVTINEEIMQELGNNSQNPINLFNDCDKNNSEKCNPSLSFKTYLFQLMIKHRKDIVPDLFLDYLVVINPNSDIMRNLQKELYMIFVQTIENSFLQKSSEEQRLQLDSILKKELIPPEIFDTMNNDDLSYELIERIANFKFVCKYLSSWLIQHSSFMLRKMELQLPKERQYYLQCIYNLNRICMEPGYETLRMFFLKNIYHQLGTDTLHFITSNEIPSILSDPNLVNMNESPSPDYFIIYGNQYESIKEFAEVAYNTQSKTQLKKYFKCDMRRLMDIYTNIKYLFFSIFQIVTESIKRRVYTGQLEGLQVFRDLINTNLCNVKKELSQIGLQMLSNNLSDGRIPCFKISLDSDNHQIALARLIYHMAVILTSGTYNKIFKPISRIYDDPRSIIDKFFPTIMEENIPNAREEAGKWFVCRNGHPYFIGKSACNPSHAQICLDCGIVIGAQAREETTTRTDNTRKGYFIGNPELRKSNPYLQRCRSLLPVSVTIIRAFIHITFIWSSCSKQPPDRSQVLHSLVKGGLEYPRDLPTFFYQHLERDMRDLTRLIGKNFEEVTFLLHLIIKSLMQTAGKPCTIRTVLDNHELRDQWEKDFDSSFIQPVLLSLNTEVQSEMEEILSNNDPLFRKIQEGEQNNPMPHLWLYRSPICLEHFSQSYGMAVPTMREKCPFIAMFLKGKSSLFVTQYLPDIVELQQRLGENFQHRLSKREAKSITIEDFLEENIEFKKLVETLMKAWSLIGDEVKRNGRLRMEDALEQQITPATSLAYLLASSTGEGVLITSLTDYLVLVHNSFVNAYRDRVKGSRSDKVPLRELKGRHVIEYEEQLQPLLLSHAHYSLALGQGSLVSYDFEGVEKQLMEQLFQNRPLILAEHLRFEYTREAYNLVVFEQVRHKVQQTDLRVTILRPIQDDLDSLEVLSDVLLVLDVVVAFLAERGGNPEQRISSYLHDVLEYPLDPRGFGPLQSRSAEEVLLTHVLSFWKYLSIEKTRKLSILGQNLPFSSLDDIFQEVVSEEERRQIENSCDYFPVEKLLFYLHEFILFYVRETRAINAELGLKKSFERYAIEEEWKVHHGFSQHFPVGIKLSQCNATWAILAKQHHEISKA